MFSGEGEYVEFEAEAVCEGPVESWLAGVVEAMKAAVQAEFKRCVTAHHTFVCVCCACVVCAEGGGSIRACFPRGVKADCVLHDDLFPPIPCFTPGSCLALP